MSEQEISVMTTEPVKFYRLGIGHPNTRILDPEHLIEIGKFWQRELRLMDWDIDIVPSERYHEMSDGMGSCRWSIRRKRATILMLTPSDHAEGSDPYDMEMTLVHEMLHITMAGLDDVIRQDNKNSVLDIPIEQHIEQLAGTLVRLRRSNFTMPWDSVSATKGGG